MFSVRNSLKADFQHACPTKQKTLLGTACPPNRRLTEAVSKVDSRGWVADEFRSAPSAERWTKNSTSRFYGRQPRYFMLTIRDLKMSFGGATLFENASFAVNYGDRVALVGPNGAGKTTLFSLILKQLEPDAGTVERDEWTMVGYLPQEAEANGDETILDVATGRVEELPQLEKRLHELEKAGDVSSPEYLETHAKHDALERSASGDEGEENVARAGLSGRGFRPQGAAR